MARLPARIAMGVVGVLLLVGYLGTALLVAHGLRVLWALRPGTAELVGALFLVTLLSAYLSYRLGTARLIAGLESERIAGTQAPGVHRRIDELAARMHVDPPALYVADMHAPNALAVGGADRGAIVLDRSLFRLLPPAEIEAIIAHELAHLETNDGRASAVVHGMAHTLVGLVVLGLTPALLALAGLARGSAWIRGRPGDRSGIFSRAHHALIASATIVLVVVTLLTRARSREREFAADDRAAEVTGDPLALARALRRIERATEPTWTLAPLSMNRETNDPFERWLATHPPTDERVERLLRKAEAPPRRRGRRGWTGVPLR